MNLQVLVTRTNSEQRVAVHAEIMLGETYISQQGVEQILQAWTDGPNKSWEYIEEEDAFVVTLDGVQFSAGTELRHFHKIETVEFLTRNAITYGPAIGDPEPKVQERIEWLLDERGAGTPENRVMVRQIVARLVEEGVL